MKFKHKNNLKCDYKRKRFEVGFAKMKSKIKLRIKANLKGNLTATRFFRRDAELSEKFSGWFKFDEHRKFITHSFTDFTEKLKLLRKFIDCSKIRLSKRFN